MLKNGAHIACAHCSIPSALFAQFDLTKHKAEEARKAAAAKPAAKPAAAPAAGTDRAAGTCAVDKAALEALDLGDRPAGFNLMTCQGVPLGWGKQAGGLMKNHYPKGLRRR